MQKTEWLDSHSFGMISAGKKGTEEKDSSDPYFLFQIFETPPGTKALPIWSNQTEGVMVWIEKVK